MSGIASGVARRPPRLSGGGKVECQVLILTGPDSGEAARAGHGKTSAQVSAAMGRMPRANIRPRNGDARCRIRSWELLEERPHPAGAIRLPAVRRVNHE